MSGCTASFTVMPLVSVIIPTRNYGQFLVDALASVNSQSYRPIEILVVDDGSTDNTQDVLSDFKPFGVMVRVFRLSQVGVSAARNRGLDEASGEFVLFLDADDILLPDALTSLMAGILADGADVCVGRWINFTSHPPKAPFVQKLPADRQTHLLAGFAGLLYQHPVISAFVARRCAVRFDPSLHVSEILDYFLALGLLNPKVSYCKDVVTSLRQHSSSNRASVTYQHFDPAHRLEIVKRWRPRYIEKVNLLREIRAVLDRLTLLLALDQYRLGRGLDAVVHDVDLPNLRSFGLAPRSWWLLSVLGMETGVRALFLYEWVRSANIKASIVR